MNTEFQQMLLKIARDSIKCGLNHGRPKLPDPACLPVELGRPRATFVTLTIHGNLRGCIGMLEASRPLAADVA